MTEYKLVDGKFFEGFWLAGWLFTLGFLKLTGWKIFWAIFIWAYYLGKHFGGFS